jgi:quercetin dioxygenase-like cupin family protein
MNQEADFFEANGVAIKQLAIKDKGTVVFQHKHEYDHVSLISVGGIQVWINGARQDDVTAPDALTIKANVEHEFVTIEDNTVLYCIHNIDRGINYTVNSKMRAV